LHENALVGIYHAIGMYHLDDLFVFRVLDDMIVNGFLDYFFKLASTLGQHPCTSQSFSFSAVFTMPADYLSRGENINEAGQAHAADLWGLLAIHNSALTCPSGTPSAAFGKNGRK